MTETEIFIPFSTNHSLSLGNPIQTYITGFTSLGLGIILHVLQISPLLSIVLIATGFLFFISPILIAWANKWTSTQFVRINHEGVLLTPSLPAVVPWGDISTIALSTWTQMGHTFNSLSFVPRDPEATIARIVKQKKHAFSRLLIKTNMLLYRRSNAPSPLIIGQTVSPIPLDELLTMIQERFASELRENRVTVLGWQESGTGDRSVGVR